MSEVRFYNDGKPIENVENSEEEYNQQDNPVQLNNMISQQEFTPPVVLGGNANDEMDELDDTINNNTSEMTPAMSEEVDELDDTINNNIPEYISTSMSKEEKRDDPIATSIEPEASFFDREESEKFNQQWMEIQGKFVD